MNLLKLFCTLAMLSLSISVSLADSRLTKEQAIQIASDFCQNIGALQPGNATAVFPLPKTDPASESYYLPCWKVTFSKQPNSHNIEIEVADATGAVAGYFNSIVSEELGDQPAGEAISKAAAIQYAQ